MTIVTSISTRLDSNIRELRTKFHLADEEIPIKEFLSNLKLQFKLYIETPVIETAEIA